MVNQANDESDKINQLIDDIEELKKQNAELSSAGFELISAQTKLQSLLHNASDGIITFSADGTVESFNISAQRIFGYSEAEIVTRKIPDLIPCPDWVHNNVGEYIRYFISSRASVDSPLLGKHRMGFDILLDISTGQASSQDTLIFNQQSDELDPFAEIPQQNESATVAENDSFVCFFRDITLDKQLKKDLEDQKHALDLAAGVITLDKDFRVIDINDNFCKMLSRKRHEFVGVQYIQAKFSGILGQESQLQQKREFLAKGNSWVGEVCFLNKEGKQIWFTESTTPFLDEQHMPYQYLSIYTDITARKQFENQLKLNQENLQDKIDEQINHIKQAKEIAENANKAKSEFLANISHELRTPMHGILSFTQLSLKQFKTQPLDKQTTEKLYKFLTNIETSSHRLLSLLNNLLDLSKLESGKENMVLKQQDLYQLCLQIGEEYLAKTAEKQLKLIINKHSAETNVLCDKSKILQVLSNLLANAIKFSTENKSIFIDIDNSTICLGKRSTDTEKTQGILLTMIDQGIGIPEEELTAVFDKFIQSSKTKSGAGGTGLGLSISKEIMLAHRGKIWAEQNPQGGAIFKLFLPN